MQKKRRKIKPDEKYCVGGIQITRFGSNTILENKRSFKEQQYTINKMQTNYSAMYQDIVERIKCIREKVIKCDPYELLFFLRCQFLISSINVFSEYEHSRFNTATLHAQEYIQCIIVSSENVKAVKMSQEEQESLFHEILFEYIELHQKLIDFIKYWAIIIEKEHGIIGEELSDLVEAQYMYLVRGHRYQIFELEPLKVLLPPHDEVLQELF